MAGSIFTFSLTLGDYIAVQIVGGRTQLIGNVVYANIGVGNNLPFAAALATIPVVIMVGYLAGHPAHRSAGPACEHAPRRRVARALLRLAMVVGLAVIYVPLASC